MKDCDLVAQDCRSYPQKKRNLPPAGQGVVIREPVNNQRRPPAHLRGKGKGKQVARAPTVPARSQRKNVWTRPEKRIEGEGSSRAAVDSPITTPATAVVIPEASKAMEVDNSEPAVTVEEIVEDN